MTLPNTGLPEASLTTNEHLIFNQFGLLADVLNKPVPDTFVNVSAPPANPTKGVVVLITGDTPTTGVFAGKEGNAAIFSVSSWIFLGNSLHWEGEEGKWGYDSTLLEWVNRGGGGVGVGSLEIEDESISVDAAVTKINFTGGVTVTPITSGEVEVNIPGGIDGIDGVDGVAVGFQLTHTTGTVDTNGEIGGSTVISWHKNDRNGVLLPSLSEGDYWFIQDETNSANYAYVLLGAVTFADPIYSAPATRTDGGAIGDAVNVRAFPLLRGLPGVGGGSALEIEDEGDSIDTAVTKINFTGSGVIVSPIVSGEVVVTIPGGVVGSGREILTANRTYYVRTDGSDSNTGLLNTPGGAFSSLLAARDAIRRIDGNGFEVTVQIGNGTYTVSNPEGVVFSGFVGVSRIRLIGNTTTPTSVTIQGGAGIAQFTALITFSGDILGIVDGVSITNTQPSGQGIAIERASYVELRNNNFGAVTNSAIRVSGGEYWQAGNFSISGGGANAQFLNVDGGGVASLNLAGTCTITNNPVFSRFALVSSSLLNWVPSNFTFSGTAQGSRHFVTNNGTLNQYGISGSFPGNSAGTVNAGGVIA
jgi:hypothetical protein